MEIQLQELLDRIKRDGMDAAEKQAASILLEAEEKKTAIIAEAEKEAATIRSEAKASAAREEDAGRAALARASRDLILSFRDKISDVLGAVVRKDVAATLDADVLRQALPGVLKALAAGGSDELAVLVDPETLKKLEGRFDALLGGDLKKGVELRPFPDVAGGFRVAEKNGAAYYDFSATTVAELFAKHLNSRLAEIVREAVKEIKA